MQNLILLFFSLHFTFLLGVVFISISFKFIFISFLIFDVQWINDLSINYLLLYVFIKKSVQLKSFFVKKKVIAIGHHRRVIFTSGQNLKLPFLCQYLIFFNDFFFTPAISFGSLL